MLKLFTSTLLLLLANALFATTDLIYTGRVAVALNNASLYPDSSYEKQSFQTVPAGVLLEVIGETTFEYEDAAQNQKFKWYKIRSPKGNEGWLFGDVVAVIVPEKQIDASVRNFHKRKYLFPNGFGKSVLWIGGIEGRDNFHEKDYMNPTYKEYYIILTNDQGQSVFVNYASENARGKMKLRQLQFLDTTGDKEPELLMQTSSTSVGSEYFENRNFEIYSFQSGTFSQIFEERMSLRYRNDTHSPALFKMVEVDGGIIRVAYLDYLDCKNYSQHNAVEDYDASTERCLEYVTYTYSWNQRTKQYRMLYDESRTAPVVGTKKDNVALINEPSLLAKGVANISRTDRLEVIKLHHTKVIEDRVEKEAPYFYVKLKNGVVGYVRASEVGFTDIEHAALLNRYYQSIVMPNLKEWSSDEKFLKIIGDNRSSFTGK